MKFTEKEVVVIRNQPNRGFIAISDVYTSYGESAYQYKLYDGNYYFEYELISQKEWEYNNEFEKMLDNNKEKE